MDSELRKKLTIPVIVFLAIFAININSIINGLTHNEPWRVGIASASSIIIIIAFIFIYRAVKKSNSNPS